MLYFSAVVASGASFAYLVDAHGSTGAVHIVALSTCAMTVLQYGMAFCTNRIVFAHGVRASLFVLGACQAACLLAAAAMYVFGKRVRSFVRVHFLISNLGVKMADARRTRMQYWQIARHPHLFPTTLPASKDTPSVAGPQNE